MSSKKIAVSNRMIDGGYYAIKGFNYQFDKTILQILQDRESDVEIEQLQDIHSKSYYIQVKYKESQSYSPAKIKKPIYQLILCYQQDTSSNYCLYCYFKDKYPESKRLSLKDLDEILSIDKNEFSYTFKKEFIKKFTLEFSENYERQFKTLIDNLKLCFGLKSDELAILHHAIIRSKLIDIASRKNYRRRIINFRILKELLSQNEKIVFNFAYLKYLNKNRYLSFLRKNYFSHKNINMQCFERLFVIEIDDKIKDVDVLKSVAYIQTRYFKKHTSPAPYICFSNIGNIRLTRIKQLLYSKKLYFEDGTHFNGDIFRVEDLITPIHNINSKSKFKIFSWINLNLVLKNCKFDEIYSFYINDRMSIDSRQNLKEFYIEQTSDIINIIN